jgi:hypothetical protein
MIKGSNLANITRRTVSNSEFVKAFFWFFKIKKWFHQILLFLILANVFLGMGMSKAMCRLIPQEVGWDTDVGMSNIRILIKSPLADFEIKICYFLYLQMYFWGQVCQRLCAGLISGKEGGILMVACLAPSSQTVGSLLRAPGLIF